MAPKDEIKSKDEEGLSLPVELEEKAIKTTMIDMKTLIQKKLDQLKDLATLEVLLPVSVRMKKRLESIKKMSSAEHIKVRGLWKTTNPQMHIRGLVGKKINNDEIEITFGVYDSDEKRRKKEHKNFSDVEKEDGTVIKKHLSSEYRIKYEVTERIKSGKPITREIVRVDRVQED